MLKCIIKILKKLRKMSYKSEINETETEISLFGKITIDKATGVVTVTDYQTFNNDIQIKGVNKKLHFTTAGDEFTGGKTSGSSLYSESNVLITPSNFKSKSLNISELNTTPTSSSDTGTLGEIRITADYIYVCVATDTWKRVAISTW